MENQEKIDAILRKVRIQLESFMSDEPTITDPIEYENKLLNLGTSLSLEVLLESRGKMPKSRNQKKSSDQTRRG
jgi:hypothetical protein